MTPEEVRLVLSEILPQYQVSQWQTYLIASVLGAAIATIGTYWGSNLKKRGEINASEALIDKVSEQLKKNTRDTEEIKTALSGRNWVSQQTWISKEKYYTALITNLHLWIGAIDGQLDCIRDPVSVHNEVIPNHKYYQEMEEIGQQSTKAINQLAGSAMVFLSERTNAALDQLLSELWTIREHSSGPRSEYLSDCYAALHRAIEIILFEAKRELHHPLMVID